MTGKGTPGAGVIPANHHLVFDFSVVPWRRDFKQWPRCRVFKNADKGAEFLKAHAATALVPADAVPNAEGVFKPLPKIAQTRRFAESGTSLAAVPLFDPDVMKFYRDLLVDMYKGGVLRPEDASDDHIIPKSWKPQVTSWHNRTTTSREINNRKRARRPEQCGLALKMNPWAPTFNDLIQLVAYLETGDVAGFGRASVRDEVYQVVDLHMDGMRVAA